MSELSKRILSGAALIMLTLTALFLGSWYLAGYTAIIAFFMMLDVSTVLKKGGYNINRIIMLSASALICPAILLLKDRAFTVLCALLFCVLAIYTVFEKEHNFKSALASLFMLIYPLLPGFLLVELALNDALNSTKIGMYIITTSIAYPCVADAFAFFGGKFFGKRKLCPQISPKKTVEGSIASVLGGGVCGAVLFFVLRDKIELGLFAFVMIGFACGILSQIGDLFASLLKRFCQVKDYGNYIPGHGGAMDRMDSISVCLIFIISIAQILGVL